jgi:hypothetical protein
VGEGKGLEGEGVMEMKDCSTHYINSDAIHVFGIELTSDVFLQFVLSFI